MKLCLNVLPLIVCVALPSQAQDTLYRSVKLEHLEPIFEKQTQSVGSLSLTSFLSPHVTNQDAQATAQAIAKTNGFLDGIFAIPSELAIAHYVIGNPAYNFAGYIVAAPYATTQLANGGEFDLDPFLKSPPQQLRFFPEHLDWSIVPGMTTSDLLGAGVIYRRGEATIIHEYGHALTFEMLMNEPGDIGKMAKLLRRFSLVGEYKRLSDYYLQLAISNSQYHDAQSDALSQRYHVENERFEHDLAQVPSDLREFRSIIGREMVPHFEFFADLIAACVLNELDIMETEIQLDGRINDLGRSFKVNPNFDAETWKSLHVQPYQYFTPLRQALAPTLERIFNMADTAERKRQVRELLTQVYKAIVADVQNMFAHPNERPSKYGYDYAATRAHNARLIDALANARES